MMEKVQMSAVVLVIGAGPAGLAAAHAAAQSGVQVCLVDDNALPGGQIWRGGKAQWKDPRAHQLWQALQTMDNVQTLAGAKLVAWRAPNTMIFESSAKTIIQITWEKLVLCSGARELLLPFPGWTLPGVTGAGGLQALVKAGAQLKGKKVIIAGTGPLLFAVADTVKQAGAEIVMVAEQRSWKELINFFLQLLQSHRGKAWQAMKLFWKLRGVKYLPSTTVVAAQGNEHVQTVRIRNEKSPDITQELACDFLACAYGLIPNLELATVLQCELHEGVVRVDENQKTSQASIWAAGEATGIGGVDKALAQGRIAGLAATDQAIVEQERRLQEQGLAFAALLKQSFGIDPIAQPERAHVLQQLCQSDTIVCRCEDVKANQLQPFQDWRSAKLVTRAGMGPCQGRICGAACQFLYNWNAPEQRQPIFPSSAATLAAIGDLD
jgi:NADPH-dependent 2,4-dienoyl-CoA reductase/sulfur reductase-like enzyme